MKRLFSFTVKLFALSLIIVGSCTKEKITIYELTSAVTPEQWGTISPSQGLFEAGEQVTVIAIPLKGYYFKNWSGDISGTNNPITFSINSDINIIAVLAEDDEDGDGVSDILDQCPNTSIGETVDVLGCPVNGGSSIIFATLGDFGSASSNEENVANLIANLAPDIIITVGDNRYGSLTMDEVIGQFYCDYLNNVGIGTNCSGGNSTINRFFPTAGNHDHTDGGGINEYLNYFDLPGTNITSSSTSSNEQYYDFVIGPVHFFTIDSYATINDPTEEALQQNWLQAQLAASTSPWKIVYFHHAPYSSSSLHGSDPNMQWPFAAWGADVVISGHDHTYERLEIDGIPYFVNGLGGRSIYNFGAPVSGSLVRYNAEYGSMLTTATETSMTFQFINIQGEIIDTFVVQ